ncbi:MAG TPA: DUF924 family protein [Caulobacteraceae bacterium]|jgi:uncharacterized protein (DUF924 family)|nr:DUF924 family protein [Caulobacteraceae bacterium]
MSDQPSGRTSHSYISHRLRAPFGAGGGRRGPSVPALLSLDGSSPQELIDFWTSAGARAWFRKNRTFDAAMRTRFEAAHLAASRGELDGWSQSGEGALALVLLLDQAPRNIYRGSAHAFATDGLALSVAGRAIDTSFDLAVPADLQVFFYMPFEHAEDMAAQQRSLALFEAHAARTGDASYLRYARIHAEVIQRFGRFPHRNAVLGRITTAEEAAFLAGRGFKG